MHPQLAGWHSRGLAWPESCPQRGGRCGAAGGVAPSHGVRWSTGGGSESTCPGAAGLSLSVAHHHSLTQSLAREDGRSTVSTRRGARYDRSHRPAAPSVLSRTRQRVRALPRESRTSRVGDGGHVTGHDDSPLLGPPPTGGNTKLRQHSRSPGHLPLRRHPPDSARIRLDLKTRPRQTARASRRRLLAARRLAEQLKHTLT